MVIFKWHELIHNAYGFASLSCLWTLLALAVLVLMVVMYLVHSRNQKKREDDFEKDMEDKYGPAGSMAAEAAGAAETVSAEQ